MPRLCLLRHGQSQWNLENRFTGWVDVNLTPQGEAEAARAGILLAEAGFAPDIAFTSVLTRAILTLNIALYGLGRLWVPVTKSWRLNERHYGGLTGLDKAETAARHGDAQVKIWRRSFNVPPPPLTPGEGHPSLRDARYNGIDVPATESLKLTLDRVGPFWTDSILPAMANHDVLVAAHGNSLRAVVKALFEVTDEDIIDVEIPTGNPLLIDLSADLRPTAARYLDPARAQDLPPVPGSARAVAP